MESSRNSQITLLVFGDSWPAGAELNDRTHAFPYLLAKMKNMHIKNFSREKTSIDHVSLALMDFIDVEYVESHDYRALFCITDPSRYLTFDHGLPMETSVHDQSPAATVIYKYFHNRYWEEFQLRRNLMLMESLCQSHGIRSFFISNWNQPYNLAKYVENVYHKSLAEILGYSSRAEFDEAGKPSLADEIKQSRGRYIRPNICHPNTQGHALIAKKLSTWIN